MDAAWLEELIMRAEKCLREAEMFGETTLQAIVRDKLAVLRAWKERPDIQP